MTIIRCATSCGRLVGTVLAACSCAAFASDLVYVDRSNGLQAPRMEAGRTEFEFSDVNGDGHVDIVSIGDHGSPYINTQEHGVMVWFGDGTGNWSVAQTGNFGYGGCALGDVNNDGLMDIAYGMHHDYSSNDLGNQLLEVALGDGSGTNWTPWDDGLATNGETWGMFGTDLADVDNDGDLDVGSLSFGCCAGVHVYLNNGDGTWTQSWGFTGGNSSMDFQFGDVNGDGFADFAVAHGSGTVYLGDGSGGFVRDDGNLPGDPWRRGVSLGDVNGDGRDEVAFSTSSGVEVWTWLAPGDWRSLSGSLSTIGATSYTQVCDMNLDGHGDIVVHHDETIRIYTGDGVGDWTLASTVVGPDGCDDAALRAGTDADHNGYPDFVAVVEEACGSWSGGTNRPRLYAEASVPTEAFIHTASPRGGETWHAGSVRFIDWHAAVPTNEGVAEVSIEFSSDGADGPWTTIALRVPDNGRFQWLLPQDLPSSNECFLRYTLHTSSDTTAITPDSFSLVGVERNVADLTGMEILTGQLLDGDLDELEQSDDLFVHTRSGFGQSVVDLHNLTVVITANTSVSSASSIDLSIETRISHPTGLMQVRLWNWNSGQFDFVDSGVISDTEQVVTVADIDAADYVEPGTGNIGLQLKQIVFVPQLSFLFDSWIDWVEIDVE